VRSVVTPPKTCPRCKLLIECCDCGPSAADTAAEQAFWDAAVLALAQPLIGHGVLVSTIIHETCDLADALVAERRKRRSGK
jgi:hypothetical protein